MEKAWKEKVEFTKDGKVKLVDLDSVAEMLEALGWERKSKKKAK